MVVKSSSPAELCSQSNSVLVNMLSVMLSVELFTMYCPSESRSLHEKPFNGSISMGFSPAGISCGRLGPPCAGVGGSRAGSFRGPDLAECLLEDFRQSRRREVA